MDMKAMMFAGGGLFLSMVATTMWISGDVTRMREEEQARREAACAVATPVTGSDPAMATAPADAGMAQQPADPAAMPPEDCPTGAGAGTAGDTAGQQAVDVNGQPIDPNGQPVDPYATTSDPYATSSDPYAGSDPHATDPAAVTPAPVDPASTTGTTAVGAGF